MHALHRRGVDGVGVGVGRNEQAHGRHRHSEAKQVVYRTPVGSTMSLTPKRLTPLSQGDRFPRFRRPSSAAVLNPPAVPPSPLLPRCSRLRPCALVPLFPEDSREDRVHVLQVVLEREAGVDLAGREEP